MNTTGVFRQAAILSMLILVYPSVIQAQTTACYLYGTITTKDNQSFEGLIRWGNEEVFLTDMFNSTKTSNDYLPYADMEDQHQTMLYIDNDGKERVIEINTAYPTGMIHTFECMFGDIRSLQIISSSRVDLELRNGHTFRLKNGSNDIGATVQMIFPDMGNIQIPWDDLQKVEFTETPEMLKKTFGIPLTGTVETTSGNFTGIIEWDQDERLDTDVLNGYAGDNSKKIRFSEIRSISKQLTGSQVVLASGEDIFLTGSNDVNSENRGVVVTIDGLGRVEIPWEAFISVTFDKESRPVCTGHSDFSDPQPLKGMVFMKSGEVYAGNLVYDMDEAFDIEFLQGKSADIEYQIPFRMITSITPIDPESCAVTLVGGRKLILRNMQDVSSQNDGILVIENSSTSTIVSLNDILEIKFKR